MLIDRLNADLRTAMKARDAERVAVIRHALAELKNARIAKGGDLTEDEVGIVIKRGIRSRMESVEQFRLGKRDDLVAHEEREIEMLRAYLPEPLTDAELAAVVDEVIQRLEATSAKDMGVVMKEVLGKHGTRVEGKKVQGIVRARLGGRLDEPGPSGRGPGRGGSRA